MSYSGGNGDWAISNGLDISSIDAIKSGLGINTTVDEITGNDTIDSDVYAIKHLIQNQN